MVSGTHCVVCQEAGDSDVTMHYGLCKHLFHRECMVMHFGSRSDGDEMPCCPACSVPIEEEDLLYPFVENAESRINWLFNDWVLQQLEEWVSVSEGWLGATMRAFGGLHVSVKEGSAELSQVRQIMRLVEMDPVPEVANVCEMCRLQMATRLRIGLSFEAAAEWARAVTDLESSDYYQVYPREEG